MAKLAISLPIEHHSTSNTGILQHTTTIPSTPENTPPKYIQLHITHRGIPTYTTLDLTTLHNQQKGSRTGYGLSFLRSSSSSLYGTSEFPAFCNVFPARRRLYRNSVFKTERFSSLTIIITF